MALCRKLKAEIAKEYGQGEIDMKRFLKAIRYVRRQVRRLYDLPALRHYGITYYKKRVGTHTFSVPVYAEHRPAARSIIGGVLYEPDTHRLVEELMRHRPGDMVHAGTFFGDMLPSFSAKCGGCVYAFEPVLENYILAKLTLQANNLKNVFLMNCGLGAKFGTAYIDVGSPWFHRGGSSKISDQGQPTSLMPIDSLGLTDVSIIQLDVEGFELPALEGARATIERCLPYILIEDNFENCSPFLAELNYVVAGTVPGLSLWAPKGELSDGLGRLVEQVLH